MTLDYVANLRNELPELFDERPLPRNWDENWIAIPFDDEVENILNPSDDRDDYQICKPKKLKKLLNKLGYKYSKSDKGSHEIWKDENGKIIPVPVHGGKDMKPGTVQSILEAATGRKLSNTEIKKILGELG